MITIGELATLAMELQIGQPGLYRFLSSRPEHSVSSVNMQTIKTTLISFNHPSAAADHDTATTNAADAANAFVSQWRGSAANGTGAPGSVIAVNEGSSDIESLTCVPSQDQDEDDLAASEQAALAELLDEWEGAEDRLERKQVSFQSDVFISCNTQPLLTLM